MAEQESQLANWSTQKINKFSFLSWVSFQTIPLSNVWYDMAEHDKGLKKQLKWKIGIRHVQNSWSHNSTERKTIVSEIQFSWEFMLQDFCIKRRFNSLSSNSSLLVVFISRKKLNRKETVIHEKLGSIGLKRMARKERRLQHN